MLALTVLIFCCVWEVPSVLLTGKPESLMLWIQTALGNKPQLRVNLLWQQHWIKVIAQKEIRNRSKLIICCGSCFSRLPIPASYVKRRNPLHKQVERFQCCLRRVALTAGSGMADNACCFPISSLLPKAKLRRCSLQKREDYTARFTFCFHCDIYNSTGSFTRRRLCCLSMQRNFSPRQRKCTA